MTYRITAAIVCTIAIMTGCLRAQDQDLQERLKKLEELNRSILERLESSEARNAELSAEVERIREDGFAVSALETSINALTSEFDDDVVTYSKLTKSGLPIKFYGFIRHDTHLNTARMNSVHNPLYVLREDDVEARDEDAHFAYSLRLTRIGIDIDAGQIGSAKVTGKIEFDFAAGLSVESRSTMRMRHGWINLDFGDVDIRFGQDWDLIAPYWTSVNMDTLMWWCGNLGDRRPQIQLMWNPESESSVNFFAELSLGLTGAIDNQDLDAGFLGSTERDGFDSGHPNIAGRFGIVFDSWVDGKRATIAVWGLWAELETDATFGGEDSFDSFVVGIDIDLPITSNFGLVLEAFYGQALSDIRGGIGQSINTATGDEIESYGGWAEFRLDLDGNWRITLGAGIDDPDDDDLGATARDLNWAVWLGLKKGFGGGLAAGLDLIYWKTEYVDNEEGDAVRVSFWVQLNF